MNGFSFVSAGYLGGAAAGGSCVIQPTARLDVSLAAQQSLDVSFQTQRALNVSLTSLRSFHSSCPPEGTTVGLPVYVGVLADPGPLTQGDLLTLGYAAVQLTASLSLTGLQALFPTAEYVYYAYPTSYGPLDELDHQLGDFGPGDMREVQTGLMVDVSPTATVDYSVSRSDHILDVTGIPGGLDLIVTP